MTYHYGLQHIFTQNDLKAQQRNWSKLLSEYDFKINYIKGMVSRVEDVLSWRKHIFLVIPLKTNMRENILSLHINDDW
jgi:hypothetical protein